MRNLDFTCLLPVYHRDSPAHFTLAMDSLLASTLAPTEILICQDGALPDDLELAVRRSMRPARARLARNPGPAGLHHNLNHAARSVRTPWIARLDADDVNLPTRFEAQVAFLRRDPAVEILGGHIIEFGPDGAERRRRAPVAHADILRMARWRSPMNHMTVMFSTDLFNRCGGYPDISRKEDYGLWLAMINAGAVFANLDQDLVRARLGDDFYRRRAGLRNISSEWKLYRLKARTRGIGEGVAATAFIARAAALSLSRPAELIYRTWLR